MMGACSITPTQEGRKKNAMLATRKPLRRWMCSGLRIFVNSSSPSSSKAITLAGKATGISAAIPSETRQTPQIMAISAMMFKWNHLSRFSDRPTR